MYKPGNGVLVLFGVNGTERLVAGVPARTLTVCISALPSPLVHRWFCSLDQVFLFPMLFQALLQSQPQGNTGIYFSQVAERHAGRQARVMQLLSNVIQHQARPTGGLSVRKVPFQSQSWLLNLQDLFTGRAISQ